MADPFIAEIRIFPFNFPPKGWAWCDGQLLSISQNTALFSLLGTTYGGDGRTTFALPNLQGNTPMQQGQGPGLSDYVLGQSGGSETVALLETEIPNHIHSLMAVGGFNATNNDPTGNVPGKGDAGLNPYTPSGTLVTMANSAVVPVGNNQPHNNMQPYLTLYFNIALQGVFPPRS